MYCLWLCVSIVCGGVFFKKIFLLYVGKLILIDVCIVIVSLIVVLICKCILLTCVLFGWNNSKWVMYLCCLVLVSV